MPNAISFFSPKILAIFLLDIGTWIGQIGVDRRAAKTSRCPNTLSL
jgi:hypothetical protein